MVQCHNLGRVIHQCGTAFWRQRIGGHGIVILDQRLRLAGQQRLHHGPARPAKAKYSYDFSIFA